MQIEHDGAHLFATTLGVGPDVILLHPTPCHHAFWLPVAELLRDQYRLTLLDLRGHGNSTLGLDSHNTPGIPAAVTMEKLAEDTHAVLQALGIARAAFVGCSIGSYTLYEYYRRFPEQMAAVVLTCGKPHADTPANKETRRNTIRAAQQPGGLETYFNQTVDTLVGTTTRRLYPQVRTAARNMMNAVSLEAMLAVQEGLMRRPDSIPTLATMQIPVCAIAAGEDISSTPAEMEVIAQHAPDVEFHVMQDAGHYAALEQPQRIAALIGDFLYRQLDPLDSNPDVRKA